MKIQTLIPAIIALVMVVGGPFGLGTMRGDPDPRAGLICYCCSDLGENCAMISCTGCCGTHAGVSADRWSPEMIPEFHRTITTAKSVNGDGETIQSPQSVYLEVPDKPPEPA